MFKILIGLLFSTTVYAQSCPPNEFKFGDVVKIQSYSFDGDKDPSFYIGLSGVVVKKSKASKYYKECINRSFYGVRICDSKGSSCTTLRVCKRDLKKVTK